MSVLTGSASGQTREDLIKQALTAAETYYGTPCVSAQLSDEQSLSESLEVLGSSIAARTNTGYTANWEAAVVHRWDRPTYGFPKCISCGIENRE